MAMIKRATTGHIDEVSETTTPLSDLNIELNGTPIKDVLTIPINSEVSIDIDLDADDEDEIAVRV